MNRRSAALTVSFVGLGASGATIPALVPVLAAAWLVSPALVSPLLSLLFLGLALSVVTAALISGRISSLTLLVAGEVLQACGLAALVFSGNFREPPDLARVCAVVLGMGFGLTEVCALRLARSQATLLSGLTGILAVTSAASPLLIGLAAGFERWQEVVLGFAALHLFAAALLLARWGASGGSDSAQDRVAEPGDWRSLRPRREHLAFFAYVGAETTLAAWFGTATISAFNLSAGQAAAATSGFWLCLAAGRFVAVPILRNHRAATILRDCLLLSTLFLVASWMIGEFWSPGTGMLIAMMLGLVLLGPIYGLLAVASPHAASARGMAGLVAAGAVGGAAISALSSWVGGATSGGAALAVVSETSLTHAVGVAASSAVLATLSTLALLKRGKVKPPPRTAPPRPPPRPPRLHRPRSR